MLHQRWLEANRIGGDVARVFHALKPQQQLLVAAQGDFVVPDPSDQLSRRIGAILASKSGAADRGSECSRRSERSASKIKQHFFIAYGRQFLRKMIFNACFFVYFQIFFWDGLFLTVTSFNSPKCLELIFSKPFWKLIHTSTCQIKTVGLHFFETFGNVGTFSLSKPLETTFPNHLGTTLR